MERLDRKREQVARALVKSPRSLCVGQVMTAEPNCIAPSTSALEVVRLFHAYRFRHLIVATDGRRLAGVISDRDVLACLGLGEADHRSTLERITAAEIMSIDLVTVEPETSLEAAVDLMLCHGISCLPVCQGGVVVGIFTVTDLGIVLQTLLRSLR